MCAGPFAIPTSSLVAFKLYWWGISCSCHPFPANPTTTLGSLFFFSEKFRLGIAHKLFLQTVVRQVDAAFAAAINELERGAVSDATADLLQSLERPLPNSVAAIHLFGTNFEVDYFNVKSLQNAQGDERLYEATDAGSDAVLKTMKVSKKINASLECLLDTLWLIIHVGK